ncbi:group II intron reverse transcriptase/maturase [Geobacillus thermoleovorans]|uniref:Group II intron reverse transcriptase/maturase n=3 Tax=Bacillales TaxID=1385 RepID=A0A2Z3N5G7_GEOTH|nr:MULTISPECIES: group II intron reverse transcriptase/maturase [Geobacillus]ABN04186.1 intron encoded protein [Bacillus sp. EA1]AMV10526.1 group II intron reverse transcriptase/maturase [Geobacillus thermoleovorans]AOL34129.1 group II intron reverse transcriptase/maturase [Geobacillus thermoleovorans]AWO73234.1 group II intron reverse transcriptase/maturase [Geobacillus thermoleovorans]EQB95222.1 RNA-directed DNA polymerase [Geobacillus sp. A8]
MYAITKECLEKGDVPRFKGLVEIASSDVVIVSAIHKIKSNQGNSTAGTDGKTISDILTLNYDEAINFVKRCFKKYTPNPIRRVHIPKPGKKEKRPLGILTIADRIIQECVRMVIEPILEAQFFQHSYGFRPYRDAKQAIERCVFICNRIGYNWVIEGDIKGFFDNVNHTILIKQLWHMGIRDRRMLMIIKAMLKAGVIKETKINEMGTPQGGIISPLLANVYLHKLDQWITREWEEKKMRNGTTIRTAKYKSLRDHSTITKPEFYVRYADDWILFTNSRGNAEKWKYRIKKYLKENLKLELSDDKTLITNIKKKPMKFLGFKIKMIPHGKGGKYIGYASADTEKIKGKVEQIRKDLRKLKFATNQEWLITDINRINSKIRGIINYYSSAPSVNRDVRPFKEKLKYASYKALKRYGAKWIPANQCYNLAPLYPDRTEQVPAIKINGRWLGIMSIGFATWIKTNQKNQKETPYTAEGRRIRLQNTGKKPLTVRAQWLLDSGYLNLIQGVKSSKIYNFEFFMNRCYAFNRDKGKCKICGDILQPFNTRTHHINTKLPLNEINKVSNLVTVCDKCHTLIHLKDLSDVNLSRLKTNAIRKLEEYRKCVH